MFIRSLDHDDKPLSPLLHSGSQILDFVEGVVVAVAAAVAVLEGSR